MIDPGVPYSPSQMAGELKEPLANVSYHFRVLAEHRTILLVDEGPVRGAMKHFYSATVDEGWVRGILQHDKNEADVSPGDSDGGHGGPA